MPSQPKRRFSRSSIDLRDLEQHDRLIHTDSAPSMVELKDFYSVQSDENTEEKYIQPSVPKTNLVDCFSSKSNKRKKNNTLDAVSKEYDDDSLARFIEDNYRYFKKQNNFTNLSTESIISNNNNNKCHVNSVAAVREWQSLARSDPEFLLFKNSSECCYTTSSNYIICSKKMKNINKNKMSAMSDSDFIVSLNDKSRKLTFKSKIPFKSILNGKFPKSNNNNKYNMLDHPPTTTMTILNIASTITSSPTMIYPTVLRAESMNSATLIQSPEQTYMECDSVTMNNRKCFNLNTNLSQSLNGFCSNNNKQLNKSLKLIQRFSSEDNSTTAINNKKRKYDETQLSRDSIDLFLRLYQREENNKNLYDDRSIDKFNYKFVLNSSNNNVASEIESTSSKLSSHFIVNQAHVSQQNYLDVKDTSEQQSIKLNENNLTSLMCQVFVSSHNVSKLDETTLDDNSNDHVPLQVNVNAITREIKTDDINLCESMSKYNKDESIEILNRVRKQSVTYDINVIHKSQDLNIDEIHPQPKSSFARRSGSMASTGKYFGFII